MIKQSSFLWNIKSFMDAVFLSSKNTAFVVIDTNVKQWKFYIDCFNELFPF
jgi:hypothetical protein